MPPAFGSDSREKEQKKQELKARAEELQERSRTLFAFSGLPNSDPTLRVEMELKARRIADEVWQLELEAGFDWDK